MVVVQDYMTNL